MKLVKCSLSRHECFFSKNFNVDVITWLEHIHIDLDLVDRVTAVRVYGFISYAGKYQYSFYTNSRHVYTFELVAR